MLYLDKPKMAYKNEVEAFKQEFFDAGETVINGSALLDQLNFNNWLDLVERNSVPETIPEDWVVSSTFLARREADDALVGVIDIRHNLGTEILATYGGHIGYAVRPSERNKGYAKAMLSKAIEFGSTLGIDNMMIGCYSDNIASKKVIEACGGRLSESKPYMDGKPMNVYWIEVSHCRQSVEAKLDEADYQAAHTEKRYGHKEVFDSIKTVLDEKEL